MVIEKPWIAWDPGVDFRALPGAMGIYEIGDAEQRTIYIGKAGGRSPYGIRGELFRIFASADALADANWQHPQMGQRLPSLDAARFYRSEVNHQYYGRWVEALRTYLNLSGDLPPANREESEQPPLPTAATTRPGRK